MRPISFADVPSLGLNLKDEGREKEGRRGKKGKRKYFPCCCCCCIDIFKYSRPLGIKKKWREGCSCPSQTEKSAALTVVYQSILFFFGRVTAVAFNDFILVSGAYLMIWGAVLLPRPAFFPLFYSWKKKWAPSNVKPTKDGFNFEPFDPACFTLLWLALVSLVNPPTVGFVESMGVKWVEKRGERSHCRHPLTRHRAWDAVPTLLWIAQ